MKIAEIHRNDCINSITGFTLTLWFQGCDHRCEDCWNTSTWNYEGGEDYSEESILEIIRESRHKNISFLGGDPFYHKNREGVINLIKKINKKFPNKKIYVWTGYTLEEVLEFTTIDVVSMIDYLIEGRFEKDLKNLNLKLRGSSNQRIYNRGKEIII